jgi:WD40 repeat protein
MAVDVSHNACAVGTDGATVAIGGEDGGIRLWNAETNTARDVGLRHPGAVLACAIGPDGSFLATGGGDGLVIGWDLARRRRRWVLEGHAGWVRACAVAPTGKWLVSGGDDGTVRVWDMADGRQRLERQGGRIRACAIAPDGTWFAGGGDDGNVRIWSLADGALIADLTGHSAPVLACPVSHDGQLLAAITDKEIHIWQVAGGERVAAMRVEQPLRGGTWIPGCHGLCLVGEAGVYRYDL